MIKYYYFHALQSDAILYVKSAYKYYFLDKFIESGGRMLLDEEAVPDLKEERFLFDAKKARDYIIDDMANVPYKTKSELDKTVSKLGEYLLWLSMEREGEDQEVWFCNEMTLFYDKITLYRPEYEQVFRRALGELYSKIAALKDAKLLEKWKRKVDNEFSHL